MPRFTGHTEKFTQSTAKRLQVREGKKDGFLFDAVEPGFFIRKFASGKAFYGVKDTCNGQQRRLKLGQPLPGNLAEMRNLAGDAIAKARLGIDVVAEARKAKKAAEAKTLEELLPAYLAIREHGSPDKI